MGAEDVENCRKTRPSKIDIEPRLRTTSSLWEKEYDPFQMFQVEHESCLHFVVTIHRGEGITKGSYLKDMCDTPDPYVILKIPNSCNPSKRTTHIDNCVVPQWNETFHFYLDPYQEHYLHVTLMDANFTWDENLGEDTFLINTLTNDVPKDHVFAFQEGVSKIFVTMLLEKNKDPDLRFSLALCQQEKDYLHMRRKKVCAAMKKLLKEDAPSNEKEVPIMGILGSGGGFRAMIALSGAVKALQEAGIMDCATYIAGLSGSSWYISTLYSHENFPYITHSQFMEELKESVTNDWKWNLTSTGSYIKGMIQKYKRGQPVSFTDFFGHLLGDVLLKREWVEFSPYEIGIAKYGTFMKTEHFGNKFIAGKRIKEFPELPLHFLQGVWGSAFTILIKRLVMRGTPVLSKDMIQLMRDEQEEMMGDAQEERELIEIAEKDCSVETDSDTDEHECIIGKDDNTSSEDEFDSSRKASLEDSKKITINITEEEDDGDSGDKEIKPPTHFKQKMSLQNSDRDNEALKRFQNKFFSRSIDFSAQDPPLIHYRKSSKDDQEPTKKTSIQSDPGTTEPPVRTAMGRRLSRQGAIKQSKKNSGTIIGYSGTWSKRKKTFREKRVDKKTIFENWKENLMTGTNILNTRTGRAGEILNPFRGLSLRNTFPLSPFSECFDEEDVETDSITIGAASRYQPLDSLAKKLFMIDSGLAFNTPYPLLLRPQRAVNIYLSFDFSKRPKDSDPPFKELLLAEKWAIQNKVPFPPVEKLVKQFEKEELKEVYIFKNELDPFCPVILHFPIVNLKFKWYKQPGVRRETNEELDFADFQLYDNDNTNFSSTNFVYDPLNFERLHKLIEFNTLLCMDAIKEELAYVVRKKREHLPRRTMTFKDVASLTQIVTHACSSERRTDLRLTISSEQESKLQKYIQRPGSSLSTDSSDSNNSLEYIDAVDSVTHI